MPSANAQEKLAARARRIRSVRRRIAASILATFVLAWGVVAFDGSMGAETTSVASSGTASASGDSSTSTDAWSQGDGSTLSTQQS